MKVVLHLSSGEAAEQDHALANARNLLADDTLELAEPTFVANGEAVRMLVAGSSAADEVASLIEGGMVFRACSNSLGTRDIPTDDLLPNVETASSGVGELTRLQTAGYGYVKVP